MTLGAIMTRAVVTVHLDDTIQRIRDIFEESRFHHVIVTDRGRVVGVISDRDLLKHLSPFCGNVWMERRQDENTLKVRAHQIMHRTPVVGDADMPLLTAAGMLLREGVSCLPVVSPEHRLLGIVTWRDLLPHCFRCDESLAA